MSKVIKIKEREEESMKEVVDKIFYKSKRKERIRKLSKDFTEDLDELILEKDGIVDQTKATKDVVMMELEMEKAELETTERWVKIIATLGLSAATIYFMKKNYDFNCQYMNLVFNQKDSMDILDPKSFNALTRSKDNFGKMIDNNSLMRGVKL